ncbi:MAG: SLC13 family permease [Aristaeellaceae bacterium]
MKRILRYLRHEAVLTIALLAALASFLLVPPGAHTLAGIDTTTLLMLFSLMTIVAGFRHMGAFDNLAGAVTSRIHTRRALARTLVTGCFLLAMIATNDVALITLVPFTILLMEGAEMKHLTLTIVLETIAANLGSMVTPIGNPQNLYLYSAEKLEALAFPALTWPYALLAFAMLMGLCGLIPAAAATPARAAAEQLPPGRLALYGLQTLLAVLTLMKLLPAWLLAAAVLVLTLALDRRVLRQVDYTLLATFVCFFVFVASVRAYAPVSALLEGLMAGRPLLTSLLASQVISNVPACLLLSPFTQDVPALMLGVNLGGLGTLVASLASLISFRLFAAAEGARRGQYMAVFTALNVLFLAALLGLAWLLGKI